MPVTVKLNSWAEAIGRARPWHLGLGLLALLAPLAPAGAELAVSQLIVELKPGPSRAQDIELFNDSPDRSYISIEPREVVDPGTPRERGFVSPDPEKLGLLVSPRRLVLEPGQRRTLRVARVGPDAPAERVYRVTVKPVVGEVEGETGLKLLVGYDLLVLVRPATVRPALEASRSGTRLTMTNRGNSSVELIDGRQCDAAGRDCGKLPGKRLYAGASWEQVLPRPGSGEYRVRSADGTSTLKF